MRGTARHDIDRLMEEVRALELVANDIEVPPERIQEYWSVSTDLIQLAIDVDEFQIRNPEGSYDDPEMLALRRRVREVASRLSELTLE